MNKEPKELKDLRIPIQMSASEVKAIDDWSFENRIRSRSEAIRRLCQLGLTSSSMKDNFTKHHNSLITLVRFLAELTNSGQLEFKNPEPYDKYISIIKELIDTTYEVQSIAYISQRAETDTIEALPGIMEKFLDSYRDLRNKDK